MGIRARSLTAVLRFVLGGLLACSHFPSQWTPHKELLGVRVLVDPDVSLTWMSSDDDCGARQYAERQALLDSLRTGLSTAGFELVSASGVPHEAVARVSEHCTDASSGETWRRVTVVLEPGAQASGGSAYGALSQLLGSPQVLALARRKAGAATSLPRAEPERPPPPARVDSLAPFAVVIGVERYAHVSGAAGARADAKRFADLAQHSLGVPSDRMKLALDDEATKGTIRGLIAWARDSVPAGGRIYVYFSGRGARDASTGIPYLLPSDGDPGLLAETALAESDLLAELSRGRAKDVLAVLESSFPSTGADGATALSADPGRPRTAVFSAASGAELSGPSADGSGGVFTRYLVQALSNGAADIDGDGQITLQELNEWVSPRVTREAKRGNRDQHPAVVLPTSEGAPSAFVVESGVLPSK